MNRQLPTFVFAAAALLLAGCPGNDDSGDANPAGGAANGEVEGEVGIDGSSTVEPISSAVSEEMARIHPKVRAPVSTSGTGGGFKRFVVGETDISDASRPIKESETEAARENGVEFIELKIAIDGLTVIVNKENDWINGLTVAQLRKIWEPNSSVTNWSDVNPDWPDEEIKLFGPGTDSGTFDYFTEVVCGESGASRNDYSASENDNVIVTGVSGEKYSLGYLGYAYYVDNQDQLKALAIAPEDVGNESDAANPGDGPYMPKGAVLPNADTVASGEYTPLSRPLFLYVNKASLKKPAVAAYLDFYLSDEGQALVPEVGYVQLNDEQLAETRAKFQGAVEEVGATIP
ncbi:MAG: phosphate ABC transporter substrate-binding protein PstS family protein [Planctomycetota bacterium]|nr:MAG: phosphate ABC transporter substrate-binding protein PstS family protein [Planctomycetota bacterium]REJ89754.1 MAG: phosphate ABC transporter substrate-binding protein PstS family protein [Planctomycetota bacterium]REK26421.1 MAG: phosphate ABC transporter substrate-binding protein PstS family protein [Planctomycetota bacterium]REK32054.1 MAG: phosphate ABC transporter substrate-binding protein PstS family protein [Planctomycetota bacterium]